MSSDIWCTLNINEFEYKYGMHEASLSVYMFEWMPTVCFVYIQFSFLLFLYVHMDCELESDDILYGNFL